MNAEETVDPRPPFPTAETVCSGGHNSFPDPGLTSDPDADAEPKDEQIRRDLMSAAPCDGTGVSGRLIEQLSH